MDFNFQNCTGFVQRNQTEITRVLIRLEHLLLGPKSSCSFEKLEVQIPLFVVVNAFVKVHVRKSPLVLSFSQTGGIFGVVIPSAGEPTRGPSSGVEEIAAVVYIGHCGICAVPNRVQLSPR